MIKEDIIKMIMLGLDLSLCETGYCFLSFDNKREELLIQGTIKSEKLREMERLVFLECALKELLHLYTVDRVAVEGYAMGIRGGRSFSIGEWGGIAKKVLYDNKIPYIIIPPMSLKKFTTGKGNSKKNVMLLYVREKWGEIITNDNIADAYALAKMGIKIYQADNNALTERLTGYEKEAIEKLKKSGG